MKTEKKTKILAIILIALFVIPFAIAEEQLFDSNLKVTAKSIYYGTLSFLSSNFLALFLIIATIFVVLIIISLIALAGAILRRV